MKRCACLGLAALAAGSLATAQSPDAQAKSLPSRALRVEAYGVCYVDNFGDPWAGSYCSCILGATACVSGGYWFDYLRWEGGAWVIKDFVHLTSCQHWWMGISGSWHSRRMRADHGAGDHKHFSCKGN